MILHCISIKTRQNDNKILMLLVRIVVPVKKWKVIKNLALYTKYASNTIINHKLIRDHFLDILPQLQSEDSSTCFIASKLRNVTIYVHNYITITIAIKGYRSFSSALQQTLFLHRKRETFKVFIYLLSIFESRKIIPLGMKPKAEFPSPFL